jgi:hypothetical protein
MLSPTFTIRVICAHLGNKLQQRLMPSDWGQQGWRVVRMLCMASSVELEDYSCVPFLVLNFTLITTPSIYVSSLCVHHSSHARQQSAVNEVTNRVPRSEPRCRARPDTMVSRWAANEGVECKMRETSVRWQGLMMYSGV